MLNDTRVASLGFFKDKVCTTRIKKEKKFKIKFQVLLKFTQILPDYKSENATLQLSIFCEKVLDKKYLRKLNNVLDKKYLRKLNNVSQQTIC